MNRRITQLFAIVLLCLGAVTSAKGQVYFINENFNGTTGTTPPTGWTNNTLSGNTSYDKWVFNNPYPRTIASPMSSPAAIFDSDFLSPNGGYEDVTLESPAFNTTGYAGVTIKWDQHFESGWGGTAIVEVFDGTSWNQVYFNGSATSTGTQTLNITSVAANKTGVKVRFRWQGDYSWWWIVDNVQVYYVVDVQPEAVLSPASICGGANEAVIVRIKNNSGFAVSNIPVSVELSGGILSGTQNRTLTRSIPANSTDTMIFVGGNTKGGGTVNVKVTTSMPGDGVAGNDVLNYTQSIIGTPDDPSVTAGSRCGPGSVTLSANPALSTDSIAWFPTNNTSGAPLSVGKTFNTAFLPGTTTFYAAALRGSAGGGSSFITTTASGNAQQGVMFDVTPKKDIILDSLSLYLTTTYVVTGTYTYRVYYRTGTFVGSQLIPGNWTSNGDYTATFSSTGFLQFDISNINLYKNTTYGIYITIISGPGASLDYTTLGGFTTYSNADMDVYCGNGVSGLFGGTFSPRAFNGALHYKSLGCASNGVPVVATINPTASGTAMSPKTGSQGKFFSGTMVDPDVNASPDRIDFTINNPTGFNNSDFGTQGSQTWDFLSTSVTTVNGTTVPSSMYTIINPGSAPGEVRLHTDTTFNDSTIRIALRVRRKDNGCDTTIERYVYIAPRPHAGYGNSTVCEGDLTQFSNGSFLQAGAMSYFWDFGNNMTSTDFEPALELGAAGTYNVKLIVTSDRGYKDSVTKAITVYEVPKANFSFVNACEGTAVTFADNSVLPTGTPTYVWEFGDGSPTASGPSTSRLYAMPGYYLAKMTVDVNGCKNTATKYVTQAPRAVPSFTFPTLQCDNAFVQFTNTSVAPAFGNASYTWNFGDGAKLTSFNSSHNYNSFQVFNVTLVSQTEFGCIDSSSQSITLKESPRPSFTISGSTCNGDALTFTNTTNTPVGSTVVYNWDFGDANSSTDQNPVHQYAGPGSKVITLMANSTNNCSGRLDSAITINLKPTARFYTADVCLGDTAIFTDNSNIADNSTLTYNWDLGESITSTATNPTALYTTAGVKNAQLTVTSTSGCNDVVSVPVNVNPKPVMDLLVASELSHDGAFKFTTNAVGAKYYWLFGDGGADSIQTTIYKYLIDGFYNVTLLVVTDKGCTGTQTEQVRVNRLGITDVNGLEGSVKMYPNPGAGNFALEFEGIEVNDITSIAVLNNLGQKVADLNVGSITNNRLTVDITNQAAGIYFIQIETANGKAAFKYNLVK